MSRGWLDGLVTAVDPFNLLMVVAGCAAGTFIGMLPGLGPITAIALLIPLTLSFDPASGLILMAGIYYGAVFGGSTSSILLNAPGTAGTVATALDGYPLARRGQACVVFERLDTTAQLVTLALNGRKLLRHVDEALIANDTLHRVHAPVEFVEFQRDRIVCGWLEQRAAGYGQRRQRQQRSAPRLDE